MEDSFQKGQAELEARVKQRTAELTSANAQLATLYQVGQMITAPLHLDEVLDLIARNTAQLLGTDTGVILLLDEAGEFLTVKGAYGVSEQAAKATRDRVGESIAGRVAQTGQPLIANDLPNDPRFYNPAAANEGLLACASVPLRVGEKIIGTLDVHSRVHRQAFTEAHLQILKMLASQAAIAIEHARLYEEARQARVELEERVQQRTAELVAANERLYQEIAERKQVEAALRESEQRYSAIFDKSPFAIALTKIPERATVDVNDAFLNLFEYTLEEVIGKTSVDLRIAEPEAQAQIAAELQATGRVHDFECTRTTKSGARLVLSLNLDWVSISGMKYVLTTIRDITKRKQAEEKLKQTVEELARSNAELQQFAYVASHDLQEPLRMVASYTQLLARRYKGKLDTDADEFITFAVEGATRMQRLINDLLVYSRVGTQGHPLRPTSSEIVLEQVLANLQLAITESQAIVSHDPLPTILADETQLLQLFQNLIGNALKFRDSQPPQAHISAQPRGQAWLCSVRDNGIGLDPEYAERIFVIFQRLHKREEYPGTGIGLAICKRIVERHGGRIWVESQPGQGATFYFTLPAVSQT